MVSMLLKLSRPLVFFDLETTGLDVEADRVVEVGLVKLLPDGTREQRVERVDPGIDIPDAAARVHGIRTEDVRGLFGRPRLSKLAGGLLEFLGDADLAGFNSIAYDVPLWLAECRRHAIPFSMTGRHQIDAKVIFNAKEVGWDRFLMGPRTLTAAVRHYCGRQIEGAHSAGHDADSTADVLLAQLERYPDLPRTVPALHDYCAELARQLSASAAS
ncbi:MAG: 3'-5' exonuclease [Planctomycetes bacterium]|nr:3'-5' exonuclease [Planctomycetota bacterium]